jgi:hypothetical protein
MGKKLAVVLSIVVIGASAAFFFRKDGSSFVMWGSGSDDPFAHHVERRVGRPGTWTAPAPEPARQPALRVPPAATAAIAPGGQRPADAEPRFRSNLSPVAALLPPIEGIAEDRENRADFAGWDADVQARAQGAARHVVEDGDTLTQLAARYLGRADAYLEIYEANRDVLDSPDLLPIGAVLKIPPARGALAAGLRPAEELDAELVPVPERP